MDEVRHDVKILDCPHGFGPHVYVRIDGKGYFMVTIQDLPKAVEIDKQRIGCLVARTPAKCCHICGRDLSGDDLPLRNYVPGNNIPLDETVKALIDG